MRVWDIFRALFNSAEVNGSQMKILDFPIKLSFISFNIECTSSRWKSYWNYALNWSNTPYGIWRIFIYCNCMVHTLFVFKKKFANDWEIQTFSTPHNLSHPLKISGIPWIVVDPSSFWKPKFVCCFFFFLNFLEHFVNWNNWKKKKLQQVLLLL